MVCQSVRAIHVVSLLTSSRSLLIQKLLKRLKQSCWESTEEVRQRDGGRERGGDASMAADWQEGYRLTTMVWMCVCAR